MRTNLTDQFVDDLYQLSRTDFSEPVLLQAKRCLLDYLGVTFAGARMLNAKGNSLLEFLGETAEGVRVIGFGRKAGIEGAAFINGLSAHVAELDDGLNSGIVHPGSPVLSALLPLAEKNHIAAKRLLTGIIVGYEATIRIACAIQPLHKQRGYHATGTCGTIGAAMGLAAMLGFSRLQIKDALSSAAVSASGSLKVLEDGSELKPFNPGQAAVTGILAASMASAGFKGPEDVLSGGNTCFLSMMTDQTDLSQLERKNQGVLGIEKIYVKPYASCRYCHPAIEAALKLRQKIQPDQIESVHVATYFLAVNKHDHTDIHGISSAKMSIPYSVAAALTLGRAGIDEFTSEHIKDPIIDSLTRKVVVRADDQLTELFPEKCAAIVKITTIDGNCYTERVDFPKGEPENPLSNEELEEKYSSLAGYGNKPGNQIKKIAQIVWNLENELPDLFELL